MLNGKTYRGHYFPKHRAFTFKKSSVTTHPQIHTDLHMWSADTQTQICARAHTQRGVISPCGCRLWECRGQWGGIGISAVFGVLQLISLDFSETAAHPDLIQSLSSPLPPSNCFCLFINSTRYLQRSRHRAAKYSQRRRWGGRRPYSQTPNLTGTLGSPVLPPLPLSLSVSLCVSCLCFCLKNINQGPSLNRRQTANPPAPHPRWSPAETVELQPEWD